MAKKGRSNQLPTMEDPPEVLEVREAADSYIRVKRLVAKNREKMNGAKERLIELMQQHDVKSVKIDDGDKLLELDDTVKVMIKTLKKAPSEDGDATVFDAE